MDYVTVFKELGFPIACVVWLGWYVYKQTEQARVDVTAYREEAKAREEKLMKINEDRELRFIDTINNLTNNVSNRVDDIESDVKEIKNMLHDYHGQERERC